MRRLVVGYLQDEAVSLNLDLKDLLILRFIVNFIKSDAPYKKRINGKFFYWIRTSYIINELPILYINSPEVLKRRIDKLIKLKLLDYKLDKNKGMYTYYAIGENYYLLLEEE